MNFFPFFFPGGEAGGEIEEGEEKRALVILCLDSYMECKGTEWAGLLTTLILFCSKMRANGWNQLK